jgi:hypothetical protein
MKLNRAVLLGHACALPSILLIVEVIALAVFQSPNERFLRYIGFDSGVDLTMQDLLRRGFRPTIDFGCIYGPLPLLINRVWYAVAGLSPRAFRVEVVLGTCLTAWGMARFAWVRRVGAAGWALIVLAMPDVLFPSYSTFVHVLEPALLVHGLAEQARGKRERALALATAACFVKPSMGYVYGFMLLVGIALASKGAGRGYWVRSLGPAAMVGMILAVVTAVAFGVTPVVRMLVPTTGAAVYRLEHYGFFHGAGREFWILPGVSLPGYFRYEVGFWLLGSAWLIWGDLEGSWRLARGRATGEEAVDDEVVACCAGLHAVFVTCFFGHRMSWTYYFPILILGLAALAKGSRCRVLIAWGLAAMLLVNDRSKLSQTYRDWSTSAPSRKDTVGLWATPAERQEWLRVLELTRGQQPVLLTTIEGSVPLVPRFAPPVAAYFCPGLTLSVEARRKASQLALAQMIVTAIPRDWRGFTLWPELRAAMEGCEPVFEGETFRVYRRVQPPPYGGIPRLPSF